MIRQMRDNDAVSDLSNFEFECVSHCICASESKNHSNLLTLEKIPGLTG